MSPRLMEVRFLDGPVSCAEETGFVPFQLQAQAKDLELAVPGTYRGKEHVVCIRGFVPMLSVIASKQVARPVAQHVEFLTAGTAAPPLAAATKAHRVGQ